MPKLTYRITNVLNDPTIGVKASYTAFVITFFELCIWSARSGQKKSKMLLVIYISTLIMHLINQSVAMKGSKQSHPQKDNEPFATDFAASRVKSLLLLRSTGIALFIMSCTL